MAVTPIPSFTVDAALTTSFGSPSTRVALPGTPASDATVRLLNLSGVPVFVALGGNTVVATVAAGVCIAPGPVPTYLGIGTNTYIAGIIQGGNSPFGAAGTPQAILNIATGS